MTMITLAFNVDEVTFIHKSSSYLLDAVAMPSKDNKGDLDRLCYNPAAIARRRLLSLFRRTQASPPQSQANHPAIPKELAKTAVASPSAPTYKEASSWQTPKK
jgi:hypothetical protein